MRAIYEIDPDFYRAVSGLQINGHYFHFENPYWNGENEAPTLPHCTSLGGYPLVYTVTEDGLSGQAWDACAECASKSEAGEPVDAYVHYEGQPVTCENCNKMIESAYGDPDEEDEE